MSSGLTQGLNTMKHSSVRKPANVAWKETVDSIRIYGAESAPRGMNILELLGYSSVVDMAYPLVTVKDRKMGYRFAAAEAAWIISGDNRVETIKPYSRDIVIFSDDGEVFFGAYGPKIKAQLRYVVQAFLDDRDTRQAVINIWRESPEKSKDIPCTISVQWLIRNNRLYCIDTMRSSDIWLGWPYDIFNFSMLSAYLLLILSKYDKFYGLELGTIRLNAGSQHAYERNFEELKKITHLSEVEDYPAFQPIGRFNDAEEFLAMLWRFAQRGGALEFLRTVGYP